MSTTLNTPAANKFYAKWEEQYLSVGMNRAIGSALPRGIVRGFKLIPSNTNMSVDLAVDPLTGDSSAIVRGQTADPLSVMYQEQNDLTLDLTAFANSTLYIGLRAVFSVGGQTVVTIRAYSESEYNTGTADEAVICGKVTVPASGLIPIGNINRAMANLSANEGGSTGRFELADSVIITPAFFGKLLTTGVGGGTGTLAYNALSRVVAAAVPAGSILVTKILNTYWGELVTNNLIQCIPGQPIHVVSTYLVTTGSGYSADLAHDHGVYIDWFDGTSLVPTSTTKVCTFAEPPPIADAFVVTEGVGIAPFNTKWARIRIAWSIDAGSFYIGDLAAWTEPVTGGDAWIPDNGRGDHATVPNVQASALTLHSGVTIAGDEPFRLSHISNTELRLARKRGGGRTTFSVGKVGGPTSELIDLSVSGNIGTGNVSFNTPIVQVMTVSAYAFQEVSDASTFHFEFSEGSAQVAQATIDSTPRSMLAHLDLPNGVTLTQIEGFFYSEDAAQVFTISMYRYERTASGAVTEIANASGSGPLGALTLTDASITSPVVNTSLYGYLARIVIDNNAAGSFGGRFRCAQISYTVPSVIVGV